MEFFKSMNTGNASVEHFVLFIFDEKKKQLHCYLKKDDGLFKAVNVSGCDYKNVKENNVILPLEAFLKTSEVKEYTSKYPILKLFSFSDLKIQYDIYLGQNKKKCSLIIESIDNVIKNCLNSLLKNNHSNDVYYSVKLTDDEDFNTRIFVYRDENKSLYSEPKDTLNILNKKVYQLDRNYIKNYLLNRSPSIFPGHTPLSEQEKAIQLRDLELRHTKHDTSNNNSIAKKMVFRDIGQREE